MSIEFKIRNTSGQYFTQWRFDTLKDVAQELNSRITIENALLDYDQNEDFHYLKCDCNGHHISIRLYKVMSVKINDEYHWVGCPTSSISQFVRSIANQIKMNMKLSAK
jgi:hypothetical protein